MTTPQKTEFAFKVKFVNYLEAKPGRTAEEVGASIYDAIRYTWTLPETSYTDAVRDIMRQTRDQDFQLLRLVNFWPTPYFKGIVSVWRDAGGQVFEQQYHTDPTTPQASLYAMDRTVAPPCRAFDAGLRPRPFPDEAASLLPGLVAATRTGLTPASDDELTNTKIHRGSRHGLTSHSAGRTKDQG